MPETKCAATSPESGQPCNKPAGHDDAHVGPHPSGHEGWHVSWARTSTDDADECDRCEGTGDRYGRRPYAGGPSARCPDCMGTGTTTPLSAAAATEGDTE